MKQRGKSGRHLYFWGAAAAGFVLVVIGLPLVLRGWQAFSPPTVAAFPDGEVPRGSSQDPASAGPPTASADPAGTKSGAPPPGLATATIAASSSALEMRQAALLQSPYGAAPINEVLRALSEVEGGPELQVILQVLALRKDEALPAVKARLRSGDTFEKHALTKLLRLCPWPETKPELLDLAGDKSEQWLARQGALYALGALGDSSAGPEVVAILGQPNCPKGVQLVAIAALARMGYQEGANAIRPFATDEDVHVRLFAARALAEFGEPVNREFLSSALRDRDYLIRQEACEALAAVGGSDITEKLQSIATNDPHEAVREAAFQALLQGELRDRTPTERLAVLKRSLQTAERRRALWIVRTILAQCGSEGRAFVETLAAENSYLGERSTACLLLSSGNPR